MRAAVIGGILLAVAVVLTVSALIDPIHPWMQPADDAWLEWITRHRTPWLTDVARVLDRVGSWVVTVPVRIAVVVVLVVRRRWTQLAAFLTALVLSELTIGPLKALIDRPRPPGGLVVTRTASFPSGHAVAAAVTAFGIVIALVPRGRRRLSLIAVATLFAGSMAWSRTYLAVHWASDTVAGVCFGAAAALLTEVVVESRRTAAAEDGEAAPAGDV